MGEEPERLRAQPEVLGTALEVLQHNTQHPGTPLALTMAEATALLAEVERLARDNADAFALLKEAYPGDFDHPNRWRSRVEKLGAWPVIRGSEKAPDHRYDPVQTIEGIVCGYCKGPRESSRHYPGDSE